MAQEAGQEGINVTAAEGQSSFSAECIAENRTEISYSTLWHITSSFIVLAVSGLGMLASLFLGMASHHAVSHSLTSSRTLNLQKALQLAKMFGIGIIAGTAWIHLLPEAFAQFSDPCLDPWWSSYGTNWVGIFGLTAAFLVQLIELAGHSHAKKTHSHHCHSHNHHEEEEDIDFSQTIAAESDSGSRPAEIINVECNSISAHSHVCDSYDEEIQVCQSECDQTLKSIHNPAGIIRRPIAEHSRAHSPSTSVKTENQINPSRGSNSSEVAILPLNHETEESKNLKKRQAHAIKRISTLVLEAGILTHSLTLGLTLGVTSDSTLPTLLIAICFHQLFEGMALGVLISDTNISRTFKIILGLLYPLTIPIGVGIGIMIHSFYESSKATLILIQGILGSLSSGILLYSTYCELIGNEINHSSSFDRLTPIFKIWCFLAMYAGAAAMAILGIWA